MKDIKLPLKDRNIVITRAKGQISEAKKIFKNAGALSLICQRWLLIIPMILHF